MSIAQPHAHAQPGGITQRIDSGGAAMVVLSADSVRNESHDCGKVAETPRAAWPKYGVTRDYVMGQKWCRHGRRVGSICVKDVPANPEGSFTAPKAPRHHHESSSSCAPPPARRTMLALYESIGMLPKRAAIVAARIIPCTLEFLIE